MLTINEIYRFRVVGKRKTLQGFTLYELTLANEEEGLHYFVFKNRIISEDAEPQYLDCKFIGYDNKERPQLVIDVFSLYNQFYISGNAYYFYVKNEISDSKRGEKRVVIESEFGLQHVYTLHQGESVEIGKKIRLNIFFKAQEQENDIFLIFQQACEDLGVFSPENVFKETGHETDYEDLFLQIGERTHSLEYLSNTVKDMNEKISNGNRLWLFDYLNAILVYSYQLDRDELQTIKKINLIIRDTEKWILEESGLLKTFSPEKREETCLKSEQNKEKAECTIEAISIIENGEQSKYLNDVLNKIRKSMYLRNKDHVYRILYEIIIQDAEFIEQHINELSEFISFSSQELTDNFINEKLIYKLSAYIYDKKREVNAELHYKRVKEINKEVLSNLIVGIGTLLNVSKNNEDVEVVRKQCNLFTDLCKYLSYLTTTDKAVQLIKKSLLFTLTQSEIPFLQSQILLDSISCPDKLADVIIDLQLKSSDKIKSTVLNRLYMTFKNNALYLTIVPKHHKKNIRESVMNTMYSIPGTGLNVVSLQESTPWENSDSLLYYKSKWEELTESEDLDARSSSQEEVYIVTKDTNNDFKNIVFCRRKDTLSKEEGVISCHGYTEHFFVDDLREIFSENMHLLAKRIVKENGKIEYDITKIIRKYSNYIADKTDKEVIGVCLSINRESKKATFITENGILCQSEIRYYENCQRTKSYILSIDLDAEKDSTPIAIILGVSTEKLDDITLLRNQLLGISKYVSETYSEPIRNEDSFPYIHLIIDNFIRLFEDNILRYNLYQIARLVSRAEKSALSKYYESCIQHLEMLESFADDIPIEKISEDSAVWNDKNMKAFPSIQKYSQIRNVLSNFGRNEDFEYLYRLSFKTNEDEQLIRMARLALSASLIASVSDDDRPISYIKAMIASDFNGSTQGKDLQIDYATEYEENSEKHPKTINWGTEGQHLEFKTSIVYVAGDKEHIQNVDEQMFVILKVIDGFLNATGGKLLIGVRDDGSVSGIEYDMTALDCNTDKYERIIRNKIVTFFSKDVNSTIDISFTESSDRTICEIDIPEYIEPISLKSEFYQRQGNETRIIKGDDMLMFVRRKIEGKSTIISNKKEEDISEEKPEEENEVTEVKVESAPVASTTVSENENIKETSSTVYLSFFEDGSYILSSKVDSDKVLTTVEIDNQSFDKNVIQCYGNGCANKVPIKNLMVLQKDSKYNNGINHDATLLNLMVLSDNDYLVVISTQQNESFIKAVPVADIDAHVSLGLRGNQLISQNFNKLESWNGVNSKDSNNIRKLITTTRANLGRKTSSETVESDVNWLNKNILHIQNETQVNCKAREEVEDSPFDMNNPQTIVTYFDNMVTKGSLIPRARKEAQKLLNNCVNTDQLWTSIQALLDSDISVFRRPICEALSENEQLLSFQPDEKTLNAVVRTIFTFDHKYEQSIDLIYPFRSQLSESSRKYIREVVKGLNSPEDFERYFEITHCNTTEQIDYLLEEKSITSYYCLYKLLHNLHSDNRIERNKILLIKNTLAKSNLAGQYIADLINFSILKVNPTIFDKKTITNIDQNGLEYFQHLCQVKANKEKEKDFFLHIDQFIGKIFSGRIKQVYQNHYLVQGSLGVNILLQHDRATMKHYVDDKVSVKITSVSKEYKTLFATEIDDSFELPAAKPLLNVGSTVEVGFSNFNGKFIPELKKTYSKVRAYVINFPPNFDFHKTYTARVYRKKNDFEYYIKLIKSLN